MATRTHHPFRPIRILVVEPNEPDARWLDILLTESGIRATTLHYSTGVRALQACRDGTAAEIDIVVAAEVLPMLTLEEFVQALRSLNMTVPIVVLGERLQPFPCQAVDHVRLTKPLSTDDLQTLWRIVMSRYSQQRVA